MASNKFYAPERLSRDNPESASAPMLEEDLEDLYEHAPCGLISTTLNGLIIKVNETFLNWIGCPRDQILNKKSFQGLMTIGGKIFYETHYLPQLHMQGSINEISIDLNCANGAQLSVLANSVVKKDTDGHPLLIRTSVFPMTERRQYETELFNASQQAAHDANHDPLTSLPNRILLEDRLDLAIRVALRHRTQCALLFIDLDRFKQVNDTMGHLVGDQVLIETAKRLQHCVRDTDTVSRRSGDEFNILLHEVMDREKIAQIAGLLLNTIQKVYFIDNHEIHISCSIGICLCPDDGTDVKTLINHADEAMYYAKSMNRNNYQFYSPTLPPLRTLGKQVN